MDAGTTVPVPAGTMRNKWFPYHVARYLTFEERKAIKRGEVEVLRDYNFEIIAQAPDGQRQGRTTKGSLDAAWQKYLGNDSAMSTAGKRHGELAAPGIEIKSIEVCSRCLLCHEKHD